MRLLSCLFCLLTLTVYGQNTKYYSDGKSDLEALSGLIKERGYQALSEFDTVSIDPVLVYAIYFKNNKMGLLDHTGKEITPAIYESIPGLDKSNYQNYFRYHKFWVVERDNLYGMIDKKGREVIAIKYKHMDYTQYWTDESLLAVLHYKAYDNQGQIFTIDTFGVMSTEPEILEYVEETDGTDYGDPDMIEVDPYDEFVSFEGNKRDEIPHSNRVLSSHPPYIVYMTAQFDKCGLINIETGDTLIPFIYNRMSIDYHYNIMLTIWDSVVMVGSKRRIVSQRCGLADTNGNILFEPVYQSVSRFNKVFKVVNQEGKMALFTFERKPLGGFIYGPEMKNGNGDYMVLQKGEKWGLVSMQGERIIPFEYDGFSFPNDADLPAPIIIAEKDGKVAVMDEAGKLLTSFTYSLIIPECNVEPGGSGNINVAHNMTANRPNAYYFIARMDPDKKWIKRYGIMDTNYQERSPCQFKYMVKCDNRSYVIVMKDSLWGILNWKTNEYLVPLELKYKPEEKRAAFFQYRVNGKYGLIDDTGKVLIPFEEEKNFHIEPTFKGLVKAHRYEKFEAYYDGLGNKVVVKE